MLLWQNATNGVCIFYSSERKILEPTFAECKKTCSYQVVCSCRAVKSIFFLFDFQAKGSLEKAKNALDSENRELQEEIRMLSGAKSDSEAKRRKQEQQIQDYNAKLQDTERARNDYQDRFTKSQVFML